MDIQLTKKMWEYVLLDRTICDGYDDISCESSSTIVPLDGDVMKRYSDKPMADGSMNFVEDPAGRYLGLNVNPSATELMMQGDFKDPAYRFAEFTIKACRKDLWADERKSIFFSFAKMHTPVSFF